VTDEQWQCDTVYQNSRDICIGMHSKDFRSVHKRKAIDAVQVLLYGLKDRDAITLVVAEGWLEHPLIEPVLYGECLFPITPFASCITLWVPATT